MCTQANDLLTENSSAKLSRFSSVINDVQCYEYLTPPKTRIVSKSNGAVDKFSVTFDVSVLEIVVIYCWIIVSHV